VNSTASRVMTPMRSLCLESRQRKPHLSVRETQKPAVGDGDTMRLASQIFQHMIGTTERWLGIDDPLLGADKRKQNLVYAAAG
jgi:hypothetical protein